MKDKDKGGAGFVYKTKAKRKYILIAKVKGGLFVKYRTNQPDKIIEFLIKKFVDVYFANFFYNTGDKKGMQVGNWTKYQKFNFKF